jgi:hypothetical protein
VPPPALVKQDIVKAHAKEFGVTTLIETGTFQGDMVAAVRENFDEIYSIELSQQLYESARTRFAAERHIKILQGDSSEVLGSLLSEVRTPCLFWLDGHYSEGVTARGLLDTPVKKELDEIFAHPLSHSHVILIDDAREFTGQGDYPAIESLRNVANAAGFDRFEVENDIIRIYNTKN